MNFIPLNALESALESRERCAMVRRSWSCQTASGGFSSNFCVRWAVTGKWSRSWRWSCSTTRMRF